MSACRAWVALHRNVATNAILHSNGHACTSAHVHSAHTGGCAAALAARRWCRTARWPNKKEMQEKVESEEVQLFNLTHRIRYHACCAQVVHDGKMASLRRIKDDVEEVAEGVECGLGAEGFTDWKEGDKIECYTVRDPGARAEAVRRSGGCVQGATPHFVASGYLSAACAHAHHMQSPTRAHAPHVQSHAAVGVPAHLSTTTRAQMPRTHSQLVSKSRRLEEAQATTAVDLSSLGV